MVVTRFEILVLVDLDGAGPAWHPAGEVDAGDVWSLELPDGARRIVVRAASEPQQSAQVLPWPRQVTVGSEPSATGAVAATAPDGA